MEAHSGAFLSIPVSKRNQKIGQFIPPPHTPTKPNTYMYCTFIGSLELALVSTSAVKEFGRQKISKGKMMLF